MVASQSGDDDWSLSDESSDLSEYASDVALTAPPMHPRYLTSGTRSIKADLAEAATKLRVSERLAAKQKPSTSEKAAGNKLAPRKRKLATKLTSSQQSCKTAALTKAYHDVCVRRTCRKECRRNFEDSQVPWKAGQPTERVRTARRTVARKKKTPLLKVVAKVDGKRVLDPRKVFQGTVPAASISLSSRAHREGFTTRLMQAGWRIEARANKITYWSPARSSIAFSSLLQIAKTYPHIVPE